MDESRLYAHAAMVPVVVGWREDGREIKVDFLPAAHSKLKAVIETCRRARLPLWRCAGGAQPRVPVYTTAEATTKN